MTKNAQNDTNATRVKSCNKPNDRVERLIGVICKATVWERKNRRFAQLSHLMFVKKYEIIKKQRFILRVQKHQWNL